MLRMKCCEASVESRSCCMFHVCASDPNVYVRGPQRCLKQPLRAFSRPPASLSTDSSISHKRGQYSDDLRPCYAKKKLNHQQAGVY